MKPFDLQAALNGEIVQLRDGDHARIVYKHDDARDIYGHDLEHKLVGFVMDKNGKILREAESWSLEGKVGTSTKDDSWDIVGMYDKPTRLEILTEAWKRGLRVRSIETGAIYDVIAETKDGDFVLESVERRWLSRLEFATFELVE
jgi:hypothetical protein